MRSVSSILGQGESNGNNLVQMSSFTNYVFNGGKITFRVDVRASIYSTKFSLCGNFLIVAFDVMQNGGV